jgi:hypothetical protein
MGASLPTLVANFRWWWRGWNGGVEVAETTVKKLLCCGFRRTGKAMGQAYQCSGMGMLGTLPPCLPTLIGLYLDVIFIGHIDSSVRCLVCGGWRGYTVTSSWSFGDHLGLLFNILSSSTCTKGHVETSRRIRKKYISVMSRNNILLRRQLICNLYHSDRLCGLVVRVPG